MRKRQIRRGLSALYVLRVSSHGAMAAPPSKPDAAIGDTFHPYVYASLRYDSTLLRFADETEARAAVDRAQADELITRAGAGLLMEMPLSLQVSRADMWLETENYQEFDQLNHYAGGGHLAWD